MKLSNIVALSNQIDDAMVLLDDLTSSERINEGEYIKLTKCIMNVRNSLEQRETTEVRVFNVRNHVNGNSFINTFVCTLCVMQFCATVSFIMFNHIEYSEFCQTVIITVVKCTKILYNQV